MSLLVYIAATLATVAFVAIAILAIALALVNAELRGLGRD